MRNVQENIKWKADFEDINTHKIAEVHQAIKVAASEADKKGGDTTERYDTLSQEIRLIENAIQA